MTFLYRINGGEVLGCTTDPSGYPAAVAAYNEDYDTASDPLAVDAKKKAPPKPMNLRIVVQMALTVVERG